jgi:hypothetical protein
MRRICFQFIEKRGFADMPEFEATEQARELMETNVYHNPPHTELKQVALDAFLLPADIAENLVRAIQDEDPEALRLAAIQILGSIALQG